jgi:hypothetical protein
MAMLDQATPTAPMSASKPQAGDAKTTAAANPNAVAV